MQIAVVLFEGFTSLDVVGPYETLQHLPGAETVLVSAARGPVRNDSGSLALVADRTFEEVTTPDIVVVPGGAEVGPQTEDTVLLEWLRSVDRGTTWTTSVCTGSLILGAAGLLTGRRATTHWLERERLRAAGAEPSAERVVFDGKYVTAAGVSAGIDMGLTLVGKIAGDRAARSVQLVLEYDPQPPYDAGSPEKAPADLVAEWRARAGQQV
ncbi:DJ-1/PfpI family protein [Streptomyces sp. NPDC058171]